MATYYWIGGTGNWDGSSTTNWSATSGGAGGAGVPNSADTVIFDAASGIGICTTSAGAAASAVTFGTSTLSLVLGANITMSGTFTLISGAVDLGGFTLTCRIFSSSNSNARSIAFGTGKIILTLTATGTPWTLNTATNFTYSGTPDVYLVSAASAAVSLSLSHGPVAGAVEANTPNFYVPSGVFTLNAFNARNLDTTGFSGVFANQIRSIYGDMVLSPTMTTNAGANATTFIKTTGVQTLTTNGVVVDFPLGFNGSGGAVEFQDALTQGSTRAFTITNGTVRLKNGVTSTVGVFSTSGANQKFLESTLAGSQATLSKSSGTVNASNLTIKDINATGGATWNSFVTNGNVDAGNNTGWDFFTQLGKYIYTRRKNKRILL